jgi:uncharacterized membrane protein
MKKIAEIIKLTLKGGLLFIVPIFTIVYILGMIFSKVKGLVDNMGSTDLAPVVGGRFHWILILLILVFICFLVGLLAKTKPAQKFIGFLENAILGNIPGYALLKRAGESVIGLDSEKAYKVILLDSGDSKQIGFLVEKIDENNVAVFMPDVPNPTSGALMFVNKDTVKELNISYKAAIDIFKSVGVLSSKYLAGKL